MAIVRYNVEVTRVDEYEIEIDDSIWTPERINDWSKTFFEAKKPKHIVEHLAKTLTHGDLKEGMEGFGYVKQKFRSMEEGDLLTQYSSGFTKVTEEQYTEGLNVIIINYKEDYETEIIKIRTK